MIKAIIFDVDGVILESARIKTNAFERLFAADHPDKVEAIVAYHLKNMGISRYVKFKHIYQNILHLPLPPEKEKVLGEQFSRLIMEEMLVAPFVSGLNKFLVNNKKKYEYFIASGTPEDELISILRSRGIIDIFNEVHGSPRSKTEIIIDILTRYKLRPEEVVFIGDAETDQRAAQETAVIFIARLDGENNDRIKAQYQINDFKELEIMLERLQQK